MFKELVEVFSGDEVCVENEAQIYPRGKGYLTLLPTTSQLMLSGCPADEGLLIVFIGSLFV
ncbi:hypothetical protein E2C01_019096 [Portunus trituberculatus]|uniref:Uncharacterized protein n=1 Tax=Portunus trituberculatus TaxID=210409 RepID=A0A5B7DWC2_PORTR|nr:hypothetical protein [Portunus trituberculatus]